MKVLRTLSQALCLFVMSVIASNIFAQDLQNGSSVVGVISTPGSQVQYTFYAEAGQTISVSLADLDGGSGNIPGDLYPYVRIIAPNGDQLGAGRNTKVAFRTNIETSQTGVHSILVSNYEGTGVGPYELHFARTPGAQEHGGLINGGSVSQTISLGDIDSYTFYSEAGNTISLSLADLEGDIANQPGDFYPYLLIYKPDGSFLASGRNTKVAFRHGIETPVTGTYTVLVMNYEGTGVGSYELHYARAPGARENGLLLNGVPTSGEISLGDIDSYYFYADVGDLISISMTDLEGGPTNIPGDLYPYVLIYKPDGDLLGSARNASIATRVGLRATESGIYTVKAMNYEGTGIGSYQLDLTSSNTNPPVATVAKTPTGIGQAKRPTFSWSSIGVATWYWVWAEDLSGNVLMKKWFSSSGSNCSVIFDECHVVSSFEFSGSVRWWVLPWNIFGNGGWSAPLEFSTTSGIPTQSNPLTPIGIEPSATPNYSWTGVANATWYYLWIDDETGSRIRKWVKAGDSGCAGASDNCSFRFDTSVVGNVNWWVRSWNSDGIGPWSARASFLRQ